MGDAPAPAKKKEGGDTTTPKPDVVAEAGKKATTEIQSLPAATQRSTAEQEFARVTKEAGAGLTELKVATVDGRPMAVISTDGKPTEVIDESGKKWKPSTTTPGVFTDGKDQRLLMQTGGEPQAGQRPQYEFAKAKIEKDKEGKPIVSEITDGSNRKWTSPDGKTFYGARSEGANEGDKRFLSNDNGTQKFEDPTQRTLSPEELTRAQATLDKLKPGTDSTLTRFMTTSDQGDPGAALGQLLSGQEAPQVNGDRALDYLSKLTPAALKQLDSSLHLSDYFKGHFNSDEQDKLSKMLRSTDVLGDRADRMFDAPSQMSWTEGGKFYNEMLRTTNAGDMKRLNDNLLEHINADPTYKKQYDDYVAKHQGEPGFNKDTAAILSYAENNLTAPYRAEAQIRAMGADKIDTPRPDGTTPREDLARIAMKTHDIDAFQRAMEKAPAAILGHIKPEELAKAFRYTSNPAHDIQAAQDLAARGEINPGTKMIGNNAEDAAKVLADMTPEQRDRYNKGKASTDPSSPDRQYYEEMHKGMVGASRKDPVKLAMLEDQAATKGGSFISDMTKFEGKYFYNDNQDTIDKRTIPEMTPQQRQDATEHYAERVEQLKTMMSALGRDPKELLKQFEQFKPADKTPGAPDTSGGAIVGGHDAAAGALAASLSASLARPDRVMMAGRYGHVVTQPQADIGAEERAKTIQQAFKNDPELFKRIQNPQTDEEKQLKAMMDPKKLFGEYSPSYEKLATEGRLPITTALKLDPEASPQDVMKYAMSGTQAERDKFLSDPAGLKALGGDPQRLEIIKNGITQGELKPEDVARAVAIGWSPPEALKNLGGYNGAADQAYSKKYHPSDSDGSNFRADMERKVGADNPDYQNFLKQNQNIFKSANADQQAAALSQSSMLGRLLGDSVSAEQVRTTLNNLGDLSAKLQKEVADGKGSPQMKAFIDAQKNLQEAIEHNRDAQKELQATIDTYANLAVQGLIVAGTGGLALPEMLAVGAGLNGGWMLARMQMKSEMLGVNYTQADRRKDAQDFTIDAVAGTAIGVVGGTQFTKLGQLIKALKPGEALTPEAVALAKEAHIQPELLEQLGARVKALPKPGTQALPAVEGEVARIAPKEIKAIAPNELPASALPKELPPPAAIPAVAQEVLPTVVKDATVPAVAQEVLPAVVKDATVPAVAQEVLPTVVKDAPLPIVREVLPAIVREAPAALPVVADAGGVLAPQVLKEVASTFPGLEIAKAGTLSPAVQEFLMKNGTFGLIGGLQEKAKGGSFEDGFISYAAVGAAAHGLSEAFGRIKFNVSPNEVRAAKPLEGEILGPEPRLRAEPTRLEAPKVEQPLLGEAKPTLGERPGPGGKQWEVWKASNGDSFEYPKGSDGQGIVRIKGADGKPEIYQLDGGKWQRVEEGAPGEFKPAKLGPEGKIVGADNLTFNGDGVELKFKYENGLERSYSKDGWHDGMKEPTEVPKLEAPAPRLEAPAARLEAPAAANEVKAIVAATEQQAGAAGKALTATQQSLQGDIASLDSAAERIQNLPDGPFKTKWEGEIKETRARIKTAQEEQVKSQDELKGIQTRLKEATEKSDKPAAEQAQRDMEQFRQRIAQKGAEPDLTARVKQMGSDLDAALKVPAVVKFEPATPIEPYPVPKVTTEALPAPKIEAPLPVPYESKLPQILAREGGEGGALKPFEEPKLPTLGGTELDTTGPGPRVGKVPAKLEEGGPPARIVPEEFKPAETPLRIGNETPGTKVPIFARLSPIAVAALGGPIAKDLGGEGEQKPKGDQPVPPKVEPPKLVPNAALIELGTVKNWEGPFHSADRILQAALGRKPTMEEIRTMTKAIQEEFAAEHGGKSILQAGLKRGDQFLRPDNVDALLGKLAAHSPALANSLKSYIQSGATPAGGIHSTKAYAAGSHHGGQHGGNHHGGHHYRVTQGHHYARRRHG